MDEKAQVRARQGRTDDGVNALRIALIEGTPETAAKHSEVARRLNRACGSGTRLRRTGIVAVRARSARDQSAAPCAGLYAHHDPSAPAEKHMPLRARSTMCRPAGDQEQPPKKASPRYGPGMAQRTQEKPRSTARDGMRHPNEMCSPSRILSPAKKLSRC